MSGTGTVRIGISGWTYAPWRGNFYPPGLLQADELSYASRQVDTIEINGTFYGLQRPDAFARWYDETPEEFCVRGQGPALHHPHQAAARDRDPARQFLRLGRLAARGEARSRAVAIPAELPLFGRASRPFLLAAAARHRSRRGTRRTPQRVARRPRLGQDRATARIAARDRDPPPELSRPGLRRALAPAPGGARLRRTRWRGPMPRM